MSGTDASSTNVPSTAGPDRCTSGIAGLDRVLTGGWPRNRLYLVRGSPGTGKTTLAMQFLLEGCRRGETVLYFTLSETREEIEMVARSHGWTLDGVELIELSAVEHYLRPESQTTLLHPSEQELTRITRLLEEAVDRLQPTRVVLDSLSELRLVAQNMLRYRRQVLSLKTFFAMRQATVLLLDDVTAGDDAQVESIAHGVLDLEHLRPGYGAERRRLSMLKLRGVQFRGGYHDYVIRPGGLEVFPRLVAAEHREAFEAGSIRSGIAELDALLGGGLDRGTSNLLIGPAGAGKSSTALQYAVHAAHAGDGPCAMFVFDESVASVRVRARALGMEIDAVERTGAMRLRQLDPAEVWPGEFASTVQQLVDCDGVRVVVIDSLNGYLNAMPDERFLVLQLHELLAFLAQRGVVSILVLAQHGWIGQIHSPVDVTYLADTVLMLRPFESDGVVRRAISVAKKRSGSHEQTIRELRFEPGAGLRLGAPLTGFRGVLGGTPEYVGGSGSLMHAATGPHDGQPG